MARTLKYLLVDDGARLRGHRHRSTSHSASTRCRARGRPVPPSTAGSGSTAPIFLGYGLAWIWAARRSPIPARGVRRLTGDLLPRRGWAGLLSMLVHGQPHSFQVVLTVDRAGPAASLPLARTCRRAGAPGSSAGRPTSGVPGMSPDALSAELPRPELGGHGRGVGHFKSQAAFDRFAAAYAGRLRAAAPRAPAARPGHVVRPGPVLSVRRRTRHVHSCCCRDATPRPRCGRPTCRSLTKIPPGLLPGRPGRGRCQHPEPRR